MLAVAAVRTLSRVTVRGRDPARQAAFVARLAAETGLDVVAAADAESAARGQDIVCTATTSREPVLRGDWVGPGTHVNLAGSNFLAKAECDAELFRRAAVVTVDSKDQARLEAGDFVAALDAHALEWSRVQELAPTLVGRLPGRTRPADITVFESLGVGLEDVAVGSAVVEEARRRGVGRELDL